MADGKVTIDTELDDSGAKKGIDGLGKLGKVGSVAMKGTAIAVGAVATGVTALGSAMVSNASKTAEYGDNIDKMSQKMGLSAQKYQEWDFIMQHSGTSMESMQASMKTLVNAVENGSDAFQRLGMSQEEVANMSQEELFENTIRALQDVEDTTERTYLAGKLMGRGATELGALLNTSAEDVDAMKKQVHDLGGVMSDESVKASASFQDSLQNLQVAFTGLKNNASADMLMPLVDIMDGLSMVLSGDADGLDKINTGINDLITNISNNIDKFTDTGLSIINSLLSAILNNLPKLIDAGIKIVIGLADAIIKALPKLVSGAIQLITSLCMYIIQALPMLIQAGIGIIIQLVNALVDALPKLIPATIDMLLTILETLIDNVDMLIDASIKIMLALTDGILNALPILIDKVPTIIEKLLKALIDNAPKILKAGLEINKKLLDGIIKIFPQLKEKGKEIVDKIHDAISSKIASIKEVGGHIVTGLWQGISDKFGWLTGQLQSFAHNVTDKLKSFFGIHSPSRVMRDEVGQWLAKGVSLGFTENNPMNEINATMQKGMNKLSDLSLNYSANMGYNGIIDYDKMADAFSKSGMPITFKGREFGRIVRSYV